MPTLFNRLHRLGFATISTRNKQFLGRLTNAKFQKTITEKKVASRKKHIIMRPSVEPDGTFLVADYHKWFAPYIDEIIIKFCRENNIKSSKRKHIKQKPKKFI